MVFCLVPKFLDATERHYSFMLSGLREVETRLRELHIPFEVVAGPAPWESVAHYAALHRAGAVVTCFGPLRVGRQWATKAAAALGPTPLLQVDGHNIVPVWTASPKLEYAARTIRPKIERLLPQFLTEFPKVAAQDVDAHTPQLPPPVDWAALDASLDIDRRVKAVAVDAVYLGPGPAAALATLHGFIRTRLALFASKRNDPVAKQISGLSPYLHFGQIAPQRCAIEINKFRSVRRHIPSASGPRLLLQSIRQQRSPR